MASRVSYKFASLPEGDQKLPPQAVTILKELKALGEDTFHNRDDLVKALDVQDGDKPNKLNARQPIERVIAFYQKRLVDEGFIELDTPVAAPKEKKAKGDTTKAGKGKVPTANPAQAAETAESVAI
jgi:hypothetical protein